MYGAGEYLTDDMSFVNVSRKEREAYIISRQSITLADWLIDNRCTVRQLSKEFDMPRSTVHKRLQCDLRDVDYDKWKQCKAILEYNGSEAVNRMAKANRERRRRR